MDEEVLDDIRNLLVDCGRTLRRFQAAETAKEDSPVSLVEVRQAREDATVYGHMAAACEKYAALCESASEGR